ncbi:MAG: hypothetical protein ACYTF0_01290 [Planctomycetota bacterium]|jgi:hypothetical protein
MRGWLIFAAVLVAVSVWLLRPPAADGATAGVALLAERPLGAVTVSAAGLTQEVSGEQVRVNGLERQVDQSRLDALWHAVLSVRSNAEPLTDIADLAAYGFSAESPRLQARGVDLRWARKDGEFWCYDAIGTKLYLLPVMAAGALKALAQRLDQQRLLMLDGVSALRCPQADLDLDAGVWRYRDDADRPLAQGRTQALLALLSGVQLNDLADHEGETTVVWWCELAGARVQRCELLNLGAGGHALRVDQLPVQTVSAVYARRLLVAAEALVEDHPFDRSLALGEDSKIRVERAGVEVFRVQPGERDPDPDAPPVWDVIWPGGRERAAGDAISRLGVALAEVRVVEPQAKAQGTAPSAPLVIKWGDGGGHQQWLAIDGETLFTPWHRAQVQVLPELLSDCRPGRFADRFVLRVDPQRVSKLQLVERDRPDGAQARILRREGGAWQEQVVAALEAQPQPVSSRPLSAAAGDPWLSTVLSAEASAVRLASADERAVITAAGERRLAVRIDALASDNAKAWNRIEDTVGRDWELVLQRDPAGGWQALRTDRSFVYHLDDAVVDEWFAVIDRPRLLASSPSRIVGLRFDPAGAEPFALSRVAGEWLLSAGPASGSADQAAVRRFILDLLELAVVVDEALVPATTSGRLMTIEVEQPDWSGRLRRAVIVVRALPDGGALVDVDDRRFRVDAAAVALLSAGPDRFRSLEAGE